MKIVFKDLEERSSFYSPDINTAFIDTSLPFDEIEKQVNHYHNMTLRPLLDKVANVYAEMIDVQDKTQKLEVQAYELLKELESEVVE